MLNKYFALGVPLALIVLYISLAIFRRKTKIPYLGFVLFIIAGFMTAFSFQVLQQRNTELKSIPLSQLEQKIGYSPQILWLPLILGIVLALFNIYRGYKRVLKIGHTD